VGFGMPEAVDAGGGVGGEGRADFAFGVAVDFRGGEAGSHAPSAIATLVRPMITAWAAQHDWATPIPPTEAILRASIFDGALKGRRCMRLLTHAATQTSRACF